MKYLKISETTSHEDSYRIAFSCNTKSTGKTFSSCSVFLNSILKLIFLLILVSASRKVVAGLPEVEERLEANEILNLNVPMGDVVFSKSQSLPVVLSFMTDSPSENSLLGSGWSCPIVESYMFQKNDNEFTFRELDGSFRSLFREKIQSNELKNAAGWSGKIFEDKIIIKSPEGWEFRYRKGKIESIVSSDKVEMQIVRSTPNSIILQIANKTVLEILGSGSNGEYTTLKLNNDKYTFTLDKRPVVETISGTRVIKDLRPTLSKIVKGDILIYDFEYELTPDRSPSLAVKGLGKQTLKNYAWNPETGSIINLNGISVVSSNSGDDHIVKYTFPDGRVMTCSSNPVNMQSLLTDVYGGTIKSIPFVSPTAIRGQSRKVITTRNSISKDIYSCIVDDKYRIIRETQYIDGFETMINYTYDAQNIASKEFIRSGNIVKKETVNSETHQKTIEFSDVILNIGSDKVLVKYQ